MAKPIKLRDFLQRLKDQDPGIEVLSHRGKGSHLMLCKVTDAGKVSYPIPTSSGEVAGPYQKAVICLFCLARHLRVTFISGQQVDVILS